MPTILIKKSDTPGSVPGTANLTNLAGGAEVAVNTADRRMYSMNSSSAVVELGTNPSSLTCADGSFTLLKAASASITNLTATSLVLSNLSIASANVTTLTSASATITNLLATSLTVSSGSTLNGGVVINEPGADVDFRVEGDTDANLIFADASADFVGIGTSTPATKLDVSGRAQFVNNGFNYVLVDSTASDSYFRLASAGTVKWYLRNNTANTNALEITPDAGSTTGLFLTQSGNLGIGTSSPGGKFNVDFGNYVGVGARFQYNSSNVPLCINALNNTGDAYLSWNAAAKSSVNTATYVINGGATKIEGGGSQILFYNAPSGTAGADITFTERMRLDSSGNLGLGVTPSAWSIKALQVNNSSIANDSNDTYIQSNAFFDGSWKYINSAEAAQYYQVNGSHVWRYAASGTAGNTISFTTAMTLDASGRLGIGVTAPEQRIHLPNSSGIRLGDAGATPKADIYYSSAGSEFLDIKIQGTTTGYGNIRFYTGGTPDERARITSGGEFCVGTTSSNYRLAVSSPTAAANSIVADGFVVGNSSGEYPSAGYGVRFTTTGNTYNYNGSDYAVMIRYGQNTGRIETFTAASGTAGNQITFTTGPYVANLGTSWTNSSDERLKNITGEIQNGLAKVCSLRAAEFTWKDGGDGKQQVGLIAQDVLKVLPEVVVVPEKEFDGTAATAMGVNYDQTVPLLVAAIKELKAELDAAKAEISALKGA